MNATHLRNLLSDRNTAIVHLCGFLAKRGCRLSDPTNYTESLPTPSNDPTAILTAVAATGEANLRIIDAAGNRCGWVYLILPYNVDPCDSVADYGVNALTEEWANEFDRHVYGDLRQCPGDCAHDSAVRECDSDAEAAAIDRA